MRTERSSVRVPQRVSTKAWTAGTQVSSEPHTKAAETRTRTHLALVTAPVHALRGAVVADVKPKVLHHGLHIESAREIRQGECDSRRGSAPLTS